MINVEAHPDGFCFLHDALVCIMHQFKSYLREKCFKHLESIENKFTEDVTARSTADASWAITHIESLAIENPIKIKLLLESHFVHWLNTASF